MKFISIFSWNVNHFWTKLAAGYFGHTEVVAMLLFSGSDPHLVNLLGLSARQEAKGDVVDVYHDFETVRLTPQKSQIIIKNRKIFFSF